MTPGDLSLPSGVLLGLASSFHCAGMCGGIGSTIAITLARDGRAAGPLLLAQAGRIAAYVAAGALMGAFGTTFAGALDREIAFRLMQWAAAGTLAWIGLATAGLVPVMAGLDRFAAPVGARIAALAPIGAGAATPIAAGIVWGLMPCAMVYGALLTAMLTGTAFGGAALMLGFGLGTLPAVISAALGLTRLRTLARGPISRVAIGLSVIAMAGLTLYLSRPGGPLCLTP